MHPLGILMQRLEIVYKASYGGMGANKYLLPHAIAETHSLIQRIHGIVRWGSVHTLTQTLYDSLDLCHGVCVFPCVQDSISHAVWWGRECVSDWTNESGRIQWPWRLCQHWIWLVYIYTFQCTLGTMWKFLETLLGLCQLLKQTFSLFSVLLTGWTMRYLALRLLCCIPWA